MELLPSLVAGLKVVCGTFPDGRKGRSGNIAMADFGLSAFAMFFMQSVSFLAFQRRLEQGHGRSNCQTLFGIEKIPSDNYIRDMLDGADPALLQPCFARLEPLLAEPAMRQAFGRLGGRIFVAWDGTEYFCSQNIGCPHCLTRKRSNGKVENYHTLMAATVVAPGHSRVVPLFPEFIATQDGADCGPFISATTSSPASPSPKCSRIMATISSSLARQAHTRRSTTSWPAPNLNATRKKSVSAGRAKYAVTIGSRTFRCATARTRCGSTGSVWRLSTPKAASNSPPPGSPACLSQKTTSPKSPTAAERDGRSRTRRST